MASTRSLAQISLPSRRSLNQEKLGNIALSGHVREFIDSLRKGSFWAIRDRVVYDGVHSGDWIPAFESSRLLADARLLHEMAHEQADSTTAQFADDLIMLAEASLKTGNPIVFT